MLYPPLPPRFARSIPEEPIMPVNRQTYAELATRARFARIAYFFGTVDNTHHETGRFAGQPWRWYRGGIPRDLSNFPGQVSLYAQSRVAAINAREAWRLALVDIVKDLFSEFTRPVRRFELAAPVVSLASLPYRTSPGTGATRERLAEERYEEHMRYTYGPQWRERVASRSSQPTD